MCIVHTLSACMYVCIFHIYSTYHGHGEHTKLICIPFHLFSRCCCHHRCRHQFDCLFENVNYKYDLADWKCSIFYCNFEWLGLWRTTTFSNGGFHYGVHTHSNVQQHNFLLPTSFGIRSVLMRFCFSLLSTHNFIELFVAVILVEVIKRAFYTQHN